MKKKEMKTIGFFAIAIMIAGVSVFSVAVADETTQNVNVTVGPEILGLEVAPGYYNYGTVTQGQCSIENPGETPIYLNNTGNINETVSTDATGIFMGIEYRIGSGDWTNIIDFSGDVAMGINQSVNTRICIPDGQEVKTYPGMVTFEYIKDITP